MPMPKFHLLTTFELIETLKFLVVASGVSPHSHSPRSQLDLLAALHLAQRTMQRADSQIEFQTLFDEILNDLLVPFNEDIHHATLNKIDAILHGFKTFGDANHQEIIGSTLVLGFLSKAAQTNSLATRLLRDARRVSLEKTASIVRDWKIGPYIYSIRELPFNQASYGWQTWGAGILLAHLLVNGIIPVNGKSVVELGSGTGLVGCLLSNLNCSKVVLTDYVDTIIDNLQFNLNANSCKHPNLQISRLDWHDFLDHSDFVYDVVLAADVLYERNQAVTLPATVKKLLHSSSNAYIIIPDRSGFEEIQELFEENALENQLLLTCQRITPSGQDFPIDSAEGDFILYHLIVDGAHAAHEVSVDF